MKAVCREGLYAGLLAGLKDPYSTYYTAEQYKELNTSNEGSYVGIGAVLQKEDGGGAKVVQLYEGGPGEQAGLKTGDVSKRSMEQMSQKKKLPTSLPWSVTVIKIS